LHTLHLSRIDLPLATHDRIGPFLVRHARTLQELRFTDVLLGTNTYADLQAAYWRGLLETLRRECRGLRRVVVAYTDLEAWRSVGLKVKVAEWGGRGFRAVLGGERVNRQGRGGLEETGGEGEEGDEGEEIEVDLELDGNVSGMLGAYVLGRGRWTGEMEQWWRKEAKRAARAEYNP